MATFQKRGSTWRAIVRKRGTTQSKTFDTKAQAQQWATALEAKLDAGISIAPQPAAQGDTLEAILLRYADEVSPSKRGGRWEEVRLRRFAREWADAQRTAASITGQDIARWRDERMLQVSSGTVARELNLLSAVFTRAIKEWGLPVPTNPCWMVSKPKKPRPRTQRVRHEDRAAIVRQLGWDEASPPANSRQWAAAVFCFALETAMRRGEVLSLHWDDMHLAERYAHLDMTKNGDSRDVPLSTAAIELLEKLGPKQGKVFKIAAGNLDKLLRQARRDCGLLHVRLHDARREAVTRMASKLSNVLELAAVSGHRELRVLKQYYAPRAQDLAAKLG